MRFSFIEIWILPLTLGTPLTKPFVSLPLKKQPVVRDNEHPVMAFQRHHDVGIKRLHHQSGAAPPDEYMLDVRTLRRRQELQFFEFDDCDGVPEVAEGVDVAAHADNRAVTAAEITATPIIAAVGPAVTTTIRALGSAENGYSRAQVNAITSNALTDSSVTPIQGGLKYIIESADIGYLAQVQIGTPPRDFLMLMDTGSADTWVGSTSCSVDVCGNHLLLGPENSSTFRASAQTWDVTYGSGNVAGNLCTDTLSIAGMGLANHAFGITTVESIEFSRSTTQFDGLMGLSFSSLSDQKVPTPLDSLKSTGQIREAVLGIALGRVADGTNVGEIVFGQANNAKLDPSSTQSLPVINQGFWMVEMGDVKVGDSVITQNGTRKAILDTGTTLVIAPEADAIAYHAQIPGAQAALDGMFTIPCTTEAIVTMAFGSAAFQIVPRDLIFQPISNDLQGRCTSAFTSGSIIDNTTWLLGDTFLKNVYMTANLDKRTVELSRRTDIQGAPPGTPRDTQTLAREGSDTHAQASGSTATGGLTAVDTGGDGATSSARMRTDEKGMMLLFGLSSILLWCAL